MENAVAPFAGAWIEIAAYELSGMQEDVAPFAGAWIEITDMSFAPLMFWSLPSRERGLKYIEEVEDEATGEVAPFAGAWIEM